MKKKKSYVPVGKLKTNLRRLSYQSKEYGKVKARAKVGVAVYKCELCGVHIYEGKSKNSYEKKLEAYPDLLYNEFAVDHITPIADTKLGWQGWDVYIERLFCGAEDMQYLCKPCHKEKSSEEQGERAETGVLKRKK